MWGDTGLDDTQDFASWFALQEEYDNTLPCYDITSLHISDGGDIGESDLDALDSSLIVDKLSFF